MSDILDLGTKGDAREWLNTLVDTLGKYNFNYTNEAELQQGLICVFQTLDEPFETEHRLSKEDRIDFYFPYMKVGVEAKIDHPLSALTRQLMRYVQHNSIDGLLLVSGKVRLTNLPESMNGKPVRSYSLIASLL